MNPRPPAERGPGATPGAGRARAPQEQQLDLGLDLGLPVESSRARAPRRKDSAGAGPGGASSSGTSAPAQDRVTGTASERPGRDARRGTWSAIRIARLLGRPEPTPEQVTVIEAPLQPLLVVAGAGSGKTETMAARVVWLVANGHLSADQVLGLTFTRKAAAELAERVRSRLRLLARAGGPADPEPVMVATYHSYAAGVLGDHGLRLGVEPSARLLTEAGTWRLAWEVVQAWDGDLHDLTASPATVTEAVLSLAGEGAEHLTSVEAVDDLVAGMLARAATLPTEAGPTDAGGAQPGKVSRAVADVLGTLRQRRLVLPLVTAYQERKRERNLLDFSDQVALAARLAQEVPAVAAGERTRFRTVLLDEYQDTSHAQLVLLRGLFGGGHPVTAVGDPHQSIYGWRGASAGTLARFPGEFPDGRGRPAAVAVLSTSWRNDVGVLTLANRIAAPLADPLPWAPQAPRPQVCELRARPGAGPAQVVAAWFATLEEEAEAVADFAAGAWAGTAEVAVLCRTRAQFPLVEEALRARGLPVEVVGLGGLLDVPEVADVRAVLELLADPSRGDAAMRLLTGPAWRLGPRDLDALGAWAVELARRSGAGHGPRSGDPRAEPLDERCLAEALHELPPPTWTGRDGQTLSTIGRRRLTALGALLAGLRATLARSAPALPELVVEVERTFLLDVEAAARPDEAAARARAQLDAFAEVAAAFVDDGPGASLGPFLAWLQAAQDRERGLEPAAGTTHQHAVQVLTVHAAKGLEWDAVAVPGLVEGTFPTGTGGRAPGATGGWLTGLGSVPFPLRGDAAALPQWQVAAATSQRELTAALGAFREHCGAVEVAEERRLAYVAVTRARSRLLLSGAQWGEGSRPRTPSRFLLEAVELPDVGRLAWADPPAAQGTNPRAARVAAVDWPSDPLAGHREAVEDAARWVNEAMVRLAGTTTLAGATTSAGTTMLPETTVTVEAAVAADSDGVTVQRVAANPFALAWARQVDMLLAERDSVSDHGVHVALPAHLSTSLLVGLAADPRATALRIRRPMPQPPDPWARRGSGFHAWLERRFQSAALLDLDELPGSADDDRAEDDLSDLQRRFLASEWAMRTPEAVEVPVETPLGGVVIRGRIDAVFRRPDGGWEIVDWKTGRPPAPGVAESRSVQLAVYRLAWARLQQVPLHQVSVAFFYASAGVTVRPATLPDEAALVSLIAASGGIPSDAAHRD